MRFQRYSNEPVETQKYWTDTAFPGDVTIYGGAAAALRTKVAVDDLGDDPFIHDERPATAAELSGCVDGITRWTMEPRGRLGFGSNRPHRDYFVRVGKITRDGKLILRGGGESLRVPGHTLDDKE